MKVKYLGKDANTEESCIEVRFSKDEESLPSGDVRTAIENYLSLKDTPDIPHQWQGVGNLGDLSKHKANGLISEILDCFKEDGDRKDLVRAAGGYIGGGV